MVVSERVYFEKLVFWRVLWFVCSAASRSDCVD